MLILWANIPLRGQVFDTLWISHPSGLSKIEGEACYVLVPKAMASKAAGFTKRQESTTLSGYITYDYQYRSLVDTPLFTRDFHQHSISGNIRAGLGGNYPVDIRFSIRKSNQPFLQDLIDLQLNLNPSQMAAMLRQKILDYYKQSGFDSLIQNLKARHQSYLTMLHELDSVAQTRNAMQERVELREVLGGKYPNLDIKDIDSLIEGAGKGSINHLFSYEEPELGKKVMEYRQQVRVKERITEIKDSVAALTRQINGEIENLEHARRNIPDGLNMADRKKLAAFIQSDKRLRDSLPKHAGNILALKTLQVGRSLINYSELTAKNMAITGVNVEVNPSWYAAAAIGFVNWQFRPFAAKNNRLPVQYAAIFRAGWGLTDKAAVVVSYFTGVRNLVYTPLPDSVQLAPANTLKGVSVELIYKLKHHQLALELAKSSYAHPNAQLTQSKPANNWMSFGKLARQNEAVALNYNGNIEATKTNFTARYSVMGEAFQCFNFFNTQAQRIAWLWDINQKIGKYFYARGGMQKNQANFGGIQQINTNVVLSKIMAGFTKPKYPAIMVGYMPSSQIIMADSLPVELNFQVLNAVSTYAWQAGNYQFMTQLTFSRFYNSGTDTGFVYSNATDIGVSQQLNFKAWQLHAGYHHIIQQFSSLRTLDMGFSLAVSQRLTLQANARQCSTTAKQQMTGYGGGLQWQIGKFGQLAFQGEKSYFPNLKNGLQPVETGRFTFTKML